MVETQSFPVLSQMQCHRAEGSYIEQGRFGGQKPCREVNLDCVNESPLHSLASELTKSDGKSQSSNGENYWLLEGVSITNSGV